MTKENFIEFIEELGFTKTWGIVDNIRSESNSYSLSTDVVGNPNSNFVAYADQLKVIISDEFNLAQLSLSQMTSHMMSGKNFGNFSLKTFGDVGDFQLELFISFIKGSFNNVPDNIIQYIRDKKIVDILQ